MELAANIEKYRAQLEGTLKTTNEIKFTLEETKPWESKLGGCPYLERLEDYPLGTDGAPMMLLAQINFDDMPPLEDFPKTGLLQFFVEADEMYGLDAPCKLRYIKKYKKDEKYTIRANPYQKSYKDFEPFDRNGKMNFTQTQMPLSFTTARFEELFGDVADNDEKNNLCSACDASKSRVGGYPFFVQNSLPYYDDGECDVLLLQLDVEGTCGIMFGDSGNCTFLISREKLRKCDFSDVEYDWQCC
ncbi:MAG: DUF1963 domain-containing protein [Butyrivibrio sp.]|nr:DUF1963 domain-containing protein [Butyrivibrio sp.]